MHAAGICLGTIQARTHVQLAFARAQRRLRLTMQHVYGHSGNLGNECADHAAALGTFGLISNHNVATRWIRHNFDASVCFDCCDNISEVLERLQHIRTNATSFHQDRGWRWFFSAGPPCLSCISRDVRWCVSFALSLFPRYSWFSQHVMDRLSSSASTVPSIDDYFEHNMRDPLWELLLFEQANGIFASWGWGWGEKLGKEKFWHRFSGDQSIIWISAISATSSKPMGR